MLNKATIIGNVGADPEVRTLESGVKVCQLRVATSERVKKGEEWTTHTEWHSIVLWRNLADVADKYIRKGSQIYIEGPIRTGEWTDKDGATHTKVEIIASELKLLGRKPEAEATTSNALPSLAEQERQLAATKRAEAYKQKYGVTESKPAAMPPLPDSEDDLPF